MSSEISLVMMVKDEENNLPRFLKSVEGVWDELVVVDTGSTDRTPEIFEGVGARVFRSPWKESFSIHRNEGIEKATKPWILVLDPDEELDRVSKPLVRKVVEEMGENYNGAWMTVRSFTSMGNYAQATSVRIFKNWKGFYYENRLHNQLKISGALAVCQAVIWHYGYAMPAEQMIEKYKHRIKLLYKDIEERPEDATLWHHAAVTHRAARELKEAVEASDRAVEMALKDPNWRVEKFSWTRFIGALCTYFQGDVEGAEKRCLVGLRECETNLDFHYLLCKINYDRGDMEQTVKFGRRYLGLREQLSGRVYAADSHYDTMNLQIHIHSMVQDALMRTGGFTGILRGITDGIGQDQIDSQSDAGKVPASKAH